MSFVPVQTRFFVTGLDKQEERFANIVGNFEAWRIYEIINSALVIVEDGAKSRVTVVTGKTRDSINHVPISESFPTLAGECFVGVPWAAALEFGYVSKSGKHVQGKNFFSPAAAQGRAEFNKMMQDYIKAVSVATGPISPPTSPKGHGHKYQYVEITSTGQKRYHYATKGATRTTFKFVKNKSIYKTPSTRGRRLRNIYGGRRR